MQKLGTSLDTLVPCTRFHRLPPCCSAVGCGAWLHGRAGVAVEERLAARGQQEVAQLVAFAAREFQHCDDLDAQIQRIEIEIQRLAGERDARNARAQRAVDDAARLEGR